MTTPVKHNHKRSIAPDGAAFTIPSDAEAQAELNEIREQSEHARCEGRNIVAVQGLGFVGAAVAAVVASATDPSGAPRHFVIGVDQATPAHYWKVGKINDGQSPIVSPDPELAALIETAARTKGNLRTTAREEVYGWADVIMVDVPLDVRDRLVDSAPDIEINLTAFEEALRSIGRHMRPDALVIIETTVPVGTCEKIAVPVLTEERAKRGIDAPLCLAHCYERVMPGPNYVNSIRSFWRTFAGINETSARRAEEFLSTFIDTTAYPLSQLDDPSSSELAKLLENSYRAVNIALIHEWTLLAERLGINLFAVIDAIRVRKGTHDNIRLPGFGVGGYCLTKDSLLAQWSATALFETDLHLSMTMDALRVNHQMPLHTFDLLVELAGGELQGKTISALGVSYLPEVADTRNSPTATLLDALESAGAKVVAHDPCVSSWPERNHAALTQDLSAAVAEADGVVFAVSHQEYCSLAPEQLLGWTPSPPLIVDAQNIIDDRKAQRLHDAGCRLLGVGKGHWRKKGYHEPK